MFKSETRVGGEVEDLKQLIHWLDIYYILLFDFILVLGGETVNGVGNRQVVQGFRSNRWHLSNQLFFIKLGIDPSKVNPTTLNCSFYNGMLPQSQQCTAPKDLRELAIIVTGEGDGKFNSNDRIIFYGQGTPMMWQRNILVWKQSLPPNFLTFGTVGKRIGTQTSIDGSFPICKQVQLFRSIWRPHQHFCIRAAVVWVFIQLNQWLRLNILPPGVSENGEMLWFLKLWLRTWWHHPFNLFYNNVR